MVKLNSARFQDDWRIVGSRGEYFAPCLPIYENYIGKDKSGANWLVQVTYDHKKRMFKISFDNTSEDDNGFPFLRHEVLDADDYFKAREIYYHEQYAHYEDIMTVIKNFVKDKGLE